MCFFTLGEKDLNWEGALIILAQGACFPKTCYDSNTIFILSLLFENPKCILIYANIIKR